MNHIHEITLDSRFTFKTDPLYQYDYGQVLVFQNVDLPQAYEVHFSNQDNSGTAKTSIGGADGVEIPDEYLTSGENIYVWVFLHDTETDGETVYKVIIPVRKRSAVSDAPPTPVQQDAITQAIAVLNQAVETTSRDVELIAGKAEIATEAAQTATDKAAEASGYLDTVARDAQTASSAAESASGSAESASRDAQTATTKAGEASQSAQSAAQSAQAASQYVVTFADANDDGNIVISIGGA